MTLSSLSSDFLSSDFMDGMTFSDDRDCLLSSGIPALSANSIRKAAGQSIGTYPLQICIPADVKVISGTVESPA